MSVLNFFFGRFTAGDLIAGAVLLGLYSALVYFVFASLLTASFGGSSRNYQPRPYRPAKSENNLNPIDFDNIRYK